jgi:hypothetical protein
MLKVRLFLEYFKIFSIFFHYFFSFEKYSFGKSQNFWGGKKKKKQLVVSCQGIIVSSS